MRLYLGEGCSSLFTYCTRVLHLSESAAYNRIEAARAARRLPAILAALEEGALTLTAVRLLARHMTNDNHRMVLESARHKSKGEIERLVASLNPQSDVRAIIRKLPTRQPPTTLPVVPAEVPLTGHDWPARRAVTTTAASSTTEIPPNGERCGRRRFRAGPFNRPA